MMARFLTLNGTENVRAEFRIARPGPQSPVKIVLHLREETGANLAVGGEPHPAARPAEGLAHRCDDADLANSIAKGVAPRRLAQLARRQLDERKHAADAFHNLGQRHHDLGRPQAALLQRHELDEPHHYALFAGNRAKPSIWFSLKPRSSTQLILRD